MKKSQLRNIVKKSQLRKIIRESIKELMNEKEGCGDSTTPGAQSSNYECHMDSSGGCKTARCCGSCELENVEVGSDSFIRCKCMGAIGLGKGTSITPTKDVQFEITEEVVGYDCKCEDSKGNIVGYCKSKSTAKGRGCGCCKRLFGEKIPNPSN